LVFRITVDDGKIVSQPSIISITVQPTNNIQPGITGNKQTTPPSLKSSQPQAQQPANDYSGLKIAFILLLLLGTVAWIRRKYRSGKHRVRRYFSESIKNKHLAIRITSVLSAKRVLGEYGIMITSMVIGPIIALIIVRYCVQIVMQRNPVDY
jgi:hypothetical protein